MATVKLGNAALTQVIQEVVLGEAITADGRTNGYALADEAVVSSVSVYVSGYRLVNVAGGSLDSVAKVGVATAGTTTSITLSSTNGFAAATTSETIVVDYVKA